LKGIAAVAQPAVKSCSGFVPGSSLNAGELSLNVGESSLHAGESSLTLLKSCQEPGESLLNAVELRLTAGKFSLNVG